MKVKKNEDFANEYQDQATLESGSRLYILVRTDIPCGNPGKLMAQAAHAGTQFVFDVLDLEGDHGLRMAELMHDWRAEGGGGFGTKITLSATEDQILEVVNSMEEKGIQAGLVVDPTYPMTNWFGEFFTRSELTCGYVFVTPNTPQWILDELKEFDLHQ